MLKIPIEYSKMLPSNILAFLSGKGLSHKEWKASAQALS